jgi:hypothetical protein
MSTYQTLDHKNPDLRPSGCIPMLTSMLNVTVLNDGTISQPPQPIYTRVYGYSVIAIGSRPIYIAIAAAAAIEALTHDDQPVALVAFARPDRTLLPSTVLSATRPSQKYSQFRFDAFLREGKVFL